MQQTSTGAPFNIIRHQDFYTVQGVLLSKEAYGDIQVTTDQLYGGRSETQSELAKTGWLGSAPLITALLTTLHGKQDQEGVEYLRKLFAHEFFIGMMTSTRITYRAEAPDLVTHDIGTPEQRTLESHLVGPDGYVTAEMGDITQALLGNKDTDKVRAVYKWITGRETNLWLINERPKQDQEWALVFGYNYFGDFGVTNIGIDSKGPARGIRVAPQSSTISKD